MTGPWQANVRTAQLTLTDPIAFREATLVRTYNGPKRLTLDGRLSDLRPGISPGLGVVLVDDLGVQRFSGFLIDVTRRGDGTGTLLYAGDFERLRYRICWPVPGSPWTTVGQTLAYDAFTGTVEDQIIFYTNRNAGLAARPERQVTGLRMPTSLGRGASSRATVRFQVLGDLVVKLAESASLQVDIVQTYDGTVPHLDMQITAPPDLTGSAQYGPAGSGTPGLLDPSWQYELGISSGNVILSAAAGEGKDRNLNALDASGSADALVWGQRVEQFVDMRGTGDLPDAKKTLAAAQLTEKGTGVDLASATRVRTQTKNSLDLANDFKAQNPTAPNAQARVDAMQSAYNDALTVYSDASTANTSAVADRVAAQNAVNAAVTSDLAEITKQMNDALAASVGARSVSVPILSTPELQVGVDVPLGAKVTAILDGEVVPDRVRQDTTVVGGDGAMVVVSAVFGDPEANAQYLTQKQLAAALRRISAIERSL